MTALGGELVCPRCQLVSAGSPADRSPAPAEPEAAAQPRPPEGSRARIAISIAPADANRPGFWRGMYRGIDEWCAGRHWWWRAPVLLLMSYWTARHLSAPYFPPYRCVLTPINLAIHEAGHLLFHPRAFGMFIQIAAGSAVQCLVPLLCAALFFKQRDYFAIALCFGWLGINLFEVAVYAADAQARNLNLVSPVTDQPIHDWAYLLNAVGIHLRHARSVAHALRALGVLGALVCLLPGSWMLWRMLVSGRIRSEAAS
jgi:hypothetical protein